MERRSRERRASGEGTLEWLPKTERWRVRITIQTPAGKKRKAFTGPTKKAVIARRDAFLKVDALVSLDQDTTVSEYLDLWLEDSVQQTRRLTTVVEYDERGADTPETRPRENKARRSQGRAHPGGCSLKCAGGATRPVRRKESMPYSGQPLIRLSSGSIFRDLRCLVWMPRRSRGAVRSPGRGSLTLEQTRRLFEAAKAWRGGRLHPILVLAVSTGMRQGEILGLLWEDFSPERGTIARAAHPYTATKAAGLMVRRKAESLGPWR